MKNTYCIQGDKVAVEEYLTDWVLVSFFNGAVTTRGYMKKEDFTKDSTLTEEQFGNAISSVDGLRVRLKPGMNEPVLYFMAKGEQASYAGYKTNFSTPATIQGNEYNEPWYYVRINDDVTGWVHGCCVEITLDAFEGE